MSVPYIWAIPPRYPNRLVGIYDRRNSLHYLSLQEGHAVNTVEPPVVSFGKATLSELATFDCLTINALIPLIGKRLADMLARLAPEDVQFVPAQIVAGDGVMNGYCLLNACRTTDCIDYDRSLVTYMLNSPTSVLGFDRLVWRTGCMEGGAVARERAKRSLLLVDEPTCEALLAARLKGLHFATADEFFPPRGLAHKTGRSRH